MSLHPGFDGVHGIHGHMLPDACCASGNHVLMQQVNTRFSPNRTSLLQQDVHVCRTATVTCRHWLTVTALILARHLWQLTTL
jgi:hypothetical protein